MRKCITYTLLFIRFLALILSILISTPVFAAVAGAPLPFDAFTADSGEITVSCDNWTNEQGQAINVTCGEPTLSDGMFQRQVTVTSSDPNYNGTYIQFIMTDPGATGDAQAAPFSSERGSLNFSNVDFIKMNNRGPGIASKLTILDSQFDDATKTEERFRYEDTYQYGSWASGSGIINPWVDLEQEVSTLQYSQDMLSATEVFNSDFNLTSNGPNLADTLVEIDQRMQLIDEHNHGDAVQKFKHTRVTGASYVNLSSDDLFGYVNGNPVLPGGTAPGAGCSANDNTPGYLCWIIGDQMSATWVSFLSDNTFNSDFGLTRYENRTNATETKQVTVNPDNLDLLEAGGGVYSYSPSGISALDTILATYDGQPLWNLIWRSLGGSTYESLFGSAELMSYVNTPGMTDFSVQSPNVLMGAASPDYIANSDSTPPALQTLSFDPVYDQWTVANGVFSGVTCPAVAEFCDQPIVNENGLYQRLIVVEGIPYYQTLMVADGGVSGDPTTADFVDTGNPLTAALAFKSETYIRANNNQGTGSGIASRLHIAAQELGYITEPVTNQLLASAGEFVYDTDLNTGWANGGGTDPRLAVTQTVRVPDMALLNTSSIEETYTMKLGPTQADKFITLAARVGTREGSDGFTQPIDMYTVTASGIYQPTSRVAVIDPFDPQYDPLLPSTGEDIGWSDGDAVKATWFGAQYAAASMAPIVTIASTSFANLTTGDHITSTTLNSTDPEASWLIDPFGPAPVYQ